MNLVEDIKPATGTVVNTQPVIGKVTDVTTSFYTKLLLHFDGTDASTTFTDSSYYARTVTPVNDAQLDTAQKKFGTASGLFDGTGDSITVPYSLDWQFRHMDFTIDFWIRLNGLPGTNQWSRVITSSNTGDNGWSVDLKDTSGANSWFFRNFATSVYTIEVNKATTVATNTWYHIAVVRNGSNVYIFQDGLQLGTTETVTVETSDNLGVLRVGANRVGGAAVNGWIDELRLTKGLARWTSNFTVPTSEYDYD